MAEKRFLAWLFGTGLLGALLTALFCHAVDPYLVFGSPRVAGLNDIKSAVTQQEPMMKAYQASRSCGKTVILGSSRSAVGLDPAAPYWPAAMRPVYNLSVAGTDLDDGLQLLTVLLAHCSGPNAPTTLVVGLDFESFLRPVPQPDAKPAPAAVGGLEQAQRLAQLARQGPGPAALNVRLWKDSAVALLTVGALSDSIATVVASARSAGANVLPNGKSSEWLLQQWTSADGPGALFHQKHSLSARRFSIPHRLDLGSDAAAHPLPSVNALLELAARHQMTVRLGVQPSHVSHHELIDAFGLWQDFERWKVAVASTAQAARERGLDVVAWDFGGYETAFLEAVAPPGGDRRPLAGFWDPVHYTAALGQRVSASLARGAAAEGALGAELRPETVAQRNLQVRQDRAAWRLTHAPAVTQALRYACGMPPCPQARSGP